MIETFPVKTVAAAKLGGLGRGDPTLCSGVAIAALGEVVGAEFALGSLTIELGPAMMDGGEAELRVRIDKRTRSVAFATAEAWAGDQMVFAARGLFAKAD